MPESKHLFPTCGTEQTPGCRCPASLKAAPEGTLHRHPLTPQGPGRQQGLPSPAICPFASNSKQHLLVQRVAFLLAPRRLYHLLSLSSRPHIWNLDAVSLTSQTPRWALEKFSPSPSPQPPPLSSSVGSGAQLGPSNPPL